MPDSGNAPPALITRLFGEPPQFDPAHEALYRLHRDKSFGFVRVALRAQAPIILHVGIGTDETYRILGRMKWPARVMGIRKYEIPMLLGWGPLPRPVKFTFYISEPIYNRIRVRIHAGIPG